MRWLYIVSDRTGLRVSLLTGECGESRDVMRALAAWSMAQVRVQLFVALQNREGRLSVWPARCTPRQASKVARVVEKGSKTMAVGKPEYLAPSRCRTRYRSKKTR